MEKTIEQFNFCLNVEVDNLPRTLFLKIIEKDRVSFSDTGRGKKVVSKGKSGIFSCLTTGEPPDSDPLREVTELSVSEKVISLFFNDGTWLIKKSSNKNEEEKFDNLRLLLS
ncbi:MAG: hypothetical protein Q7R99_01535 [bacterium]|nr:hypothetical protein [bacterium]